MKRFALALASALSIASGTPAANAQQASQWNVKVDTDKLTDKKVLVATTQSAVERSSYQLELRCEGSKVTAITLAMFTGSDPRPVVWDIPLSSKFGTLVKQYRYRIDDDAPGGALLKGGDYNNAGLLTNELMLFTPMTWDPLLRFNRLLPNEATSAVPKSRLLVADVFPDETVEFRFDRLSADYRAAIQNVCGLR